MTGASREIEFIILATTKVGDTSLVLHTLSQEYGRHSFIVTLRKSSGLYMPLNILTARITESSRTDLWKATDVKAAWPLSGIRSNIHKNTITLFLSEVLYRSLKDGANEENLYPWCRTMILTLDSLQSDFASFHLKFLLDYAAALGFRADIQNLSPFAGERREDLERLLTLDFGEFLLYPLDGRRRNEIAEILLEYLSYHLDSRLNIQSLKVLRELYS